MSTGVGRAHPPLPERNQTMFYNHNESLSDFELITLIDAMYDAGCDPAFDAVYDDLEREFAERRMHNRHA